ncbi:MAG TPA: sigma-70 family RNA polymerase sigma factor [bacterium]|nr:sigma-70 family RNA polymerase sigma factor [bacterium]
MEPVRATSERRDATDEELMQRLAAGHQDALGPLYTRYATRIFGLASQSLERQAAEEVVQDVFLAVWRKAETFEPERGTFRPWVFQIAHHRVLNELRRRSRQPALDPDPEWERLSAIPDPGLTPEEAAGRAEDRARLRSAMENLPPAQRSALTLAFGEELSHAEVAKRLDLPLGTAKTRIRAGLERLRAGLSPAAAALVIGAIGLAALGGMWYRSDLAARARDTRALALLTSSETVAIRLTPAPGVPAATHAVYRGQPGVTIAVLTFDKFPPAPQGHTYQAWVRHGTRWISLGTARPDVEGDARLIVEGPELAALPDAIEVTREAAGGSQVPTGPVIVRAEPTR